MSAIGTKRTSPGALHMSAFGGKADIQLPPINTVIGAKRANKFTPQPKRPEGCRRCYPAQTNSLWFGRWFKAEQSNVLSELATRRHHSWQPTLFSADCASVPESSSQDAEYLRSQISDRSSYTLYCFERSHFANRPEFGTPKISTRLHQSYIVVFTFPGFLE
jgi:hypothetical protein